MADSPARTMAQVRWNPGDGGFGLARDLQRLGRCLTPDLVIRDCRVETSDGRCRVILRGSVVTPASRAGTAVRHVSGCGSAPTEGRGSEGFPHPADRRRLALAAAVARLAEASGLGLRICRRRAGVDQTGVGRLVEDPASSSGESGRA